MKVVELNFRTFQFRYLLKNRIFVKEEDDKWILYTNDDIFIIKCVVEKFADQAENMMFIERYLSGQGIIKVQDITDGEPVEEDFPEELFEEVAGGIEEESSPERTG